MSYFFVDLSLRFPCFDFRFAFTETIPMHLEAHSLLVFADSASFQRPDEEPKGLAVARNLQY